MDIYIFLDSSYLDLFDSILLWSTPNAQGRCNFIFFWDSVYPLHIVNLPFIYVDVLQKLEHLQKIFYISY